MPRGDVPRPRSTPVKHMAGLAVLLTLPAMTFFSWPAFSQLASTLLNPLVAAWIRSEVENVDNLKVQISGSDQAIFNGTIQQANVSGDNLRYQGFRVSQLQLNGQNIRLNVPEATQGKGKLKLLAPVPVQVSMTLTEADLNQTLQSPSIKSQLAQAKVNLPIAGGQSVPFLIADPKVKLEAGQLRVQATLSTPDGTKVPVTLTTGLQVQSQNQLRLINPSWISNGQSIPVPGLDNLPIDLGPDVKVQSLELHSGKVLYTGNLTIQPDKVSIPQG